MDIVSGTIVYKPHIKGITRKAITIGRQYPYTVPDDTIQGFGIELLKVERPFVFAPYLKAIRLINNSDPPLTFPPMVPEFKVFGFGLLGVRILYLTFRVFFFSCSLIHS
jgi:hypothetical protein